MAYTVKTALVIAKGPAGHVYLYHGATVPAHIEKDEIKRLVDGGFIEDTAIPEQESPEPVRPAEAGPGSAKEKWVEYAGARGVDIDSDASREDIITAVKAAGH